MNQDNETRYREEFEIYAKLNSHTGRKFYTNLNDYEDAKIQERWMDYLAACKKRQEDVDKWRKCASDNEQFWQFKRTEMLNQIEKRDKLLSHILGVMKGRLHQEYDGEITIVESEYAQWFSDYEEILK
jgi:hypothetical protein